MEDFRRELERSGYLHRPLTYIPENALEEQRKKVKVIRNKVIFAGERTLEGETEGICWSEGMAEDGDYAFYGNLTAGFVFDRDNWTDYDRLRFLVRPDCDGTYVTEVTVGIVNDGKEKIPDNYYREGNHVISLRNHEWNDCLWEFGGMSRDAILQLSFAFRKNGREASGGKHLSYQIKEIVLEKTKSPLKDCGWACEDGKIAYATTGYFVRGDKKAVTGIEDKIFYIVSDDTGEAVYQGIPQKVEFGYENMFLLDFSEMTAPGRYHIRIGEVRTPMFVIDEGIYEEAVWKSLNFLLCERCGYPVRGRHGICHMDVVATHQGKLLPFCGGWHDAGDLSQQMTHTAEGVAALFSLADSKGIREHYPMLKERLEEEAIWGLEFVLRTRFGDGYRATSAGLVRWTRGYIGDRDDVTARVHNHAVENLLASAVCSYAAMVLKDEERDLAFRCAATAREDFEFGIMQFERCGMELPVAWEHTYGLSLSQGYALVVIAAARLVLFDREETFTGYVETYTEKLLSCQETDEQLPICGCFYRKEQGQEILHANHQSREYLCVMALTEAYKVVTEEKSRKRVQRAICLYGRYLKTLMEHASPYGMFPAGIYHEREAENEEVFSLQHLQADYRAEKIHYLKQLQAGYPMGNGYYLRQFPIWFSFRGNSAIHLAFGRAAGIVGNFLQDDTYLQMAREQLYWINGKNPFVQSLQYGEGRNYAIQYAPLPGEMIGEMPVGMQTKEDGDEPYWPHTNNATYKEVWTSVTNRWMWVLAEVIRGDGKK